MSAPSARVSREHLGARRGKAVRRWEPTTRRAVVVERVLRDNPWLAGKESLGEADRGALDPYAGAEAIADFCLPAGAAVRAAQPSSAGFSRAPGALNASRGVDEVVFVLSGGGADGSRER